MRFKKFMGIVHLWLGLASGLLVCFLGLSGCILAFQREIERITVDEQYVLPQKAEMLPPSVLRQSAAVALPGKVLHSVTYAGSDHAAVVSSYHSDPDYYYLIYINPYSGRVLRVRDMNRDFFRIVLDGHFYLWLPPAIGKPIVASGTLIFVVLMISGMILWWPKNKAARKQRFTIKWQARWRRVNYDLHSVLGFYMSWVSIFIAITGLVWGFEWMSQLVYRLSSGGKAPIAFYEPLSDPSAKRNTNLSPEDVLFGNMRREYPEAATLEVHFPATDSSALEVAANPDADTYWQTDYRYFDRYTLRELPVTHPYGRYRQAGVADKITRMNYDVHVGAIAGLPGKVLAFCASLLAASLPVTGFLIWRGRRKKTKAQG